MSTEAHTYASEAHLSLQIANDKRQAGDSGRHVWIEQATAEALVSIAHSLLELARLQDNANRLEELKLGVEMR